MKLSVAIALAAVLSTPAIAGAESAADCHVGAYRLSDGRMIDLAPDDAGLRYRMFDGTTGALRAARDGTWSSTLGWTERPDGKHFALGAC